MTKQTIDNLQPGTLDGDSLFRTAEKINENFNEIYSHFGDGRNLDDGYAGLKGLNAGLIASAGAGGYNVREIVAGSTAVSITNGTGGAGNPTIDLPDTGVLSAGSSATVFADVGLTVDVKGRIVSISTPTLLTSAQTQSANAASSATAAATSATASATSATASAASATSAANDVATIGTSVTDAATHATNAGTSATSAATSATTATTQVGLATTQATNASNSATAASTSETNASNSATAAATSETNAGNSATAAATSATNAANSLASMGSNVTQAQTAATNAANSFDAFDDRYLGEKSSAPTVDNDGNTLITGALYFNSTSDTMFVRTSGGSWTQAGSAVNGTTNRQSYIATAGQTSFSATYDVGYIDVYLNGIKLSSSDFTASNGSSFVLGSAAAAGDQVDSIAYGAFSVANHYTKTEADTLLAAKATTADLATTNTTVGTKASQADLNTLTTTVGTKAPLNSPNFTGTPQISGSNIITSATVPAAGLSTSFVAQGSIGAGVAVGLRSDGKVEVVTGSATISSNPVVFDASGVHVIGLTAYFDPDENRVIVIYRDSGNSNYTTAIAGTPSGTTIAFNGSPTVLSAFDAQYFASCYDTANDRGVVVNRRVDNANLYQKFTYNLDVSGDTITSQGSHAIGGQGSDQAAKFLDVSYDTAQDKTLLTFRDPSNDGGGYNYVRGSVLTISGDSNYYNASGSGSGSADNIGSYNQVHSKIRTDYNATAGCHLVPYRNTSAHMTCRVVTISSGAIVLGTEITDSSQVSKHNESVVAITGTSNFLYTGVDGVLLITRVISVSGTTPTYHTAVSGRNVNSAHLRLIYDPDQAKGVIFYDDPTTGLGKMRGLSISGTTVTEDVSDHDTSTGSKSSTAFTEITPVYDTTNDRIVLSGRTSESPQQGISKIVKLGETNNASFIGISDESATNGGTVSVTVKGGVASNLTSLTILSDYYVQADGTITTTTTLPAIKIGTALSATKLAMIGFS